MHFWPLCFNFGFLLDNNAQTLLGRSRTRVQQAMCPCPIFYSFKSLTLEGCFRDTPQASIQYGMYAMSYIKTYVYIIVKI